MEYPKNGSIVIVDDQIDDVEDLLLAFSQQNVPTYYFSGKEDKLHRNLDNIKLVFLDADYKHNGQPTSQNKIDYMSQIICSLINEQASDYIIITWSTSGSTFVEPLQERLNLIHKMADKLPPEKKLYKLPKKILSITKIEVKINGKFNTDLINQRINEILDTNDILNLSISWENSVLQSAKNVLKNFKEIASTDEEQKKIFSFFADSLSKNNTLNSENILAPALSPISVLLSDQLSIHNSKLFNPLIGEQLVNYISHKTDIDTVAKVNTFYHVDSIESLNHAPGSVYKYNDYMKEYSCSSNDCNTKWSEHLLDKVLVKLEIPTKKFDKEFHDNLNTKNVKEILEVLSSERIDTLIQLNAIIHNLKEGIYDNKSIFQELTKTNDQKNVLKKFYIQNEQEKFLNELKDNCIPIFLEFSPDCDFVQSKRKKLRLIFGILIPYNFRNILNDEKKLNLLKIPGENIITTPLIRYNEINYQVVFDLHTVTGINEEAFKNMNSIFRFRKELIVDIQHKIATHISRPGFFNMNDYLA